MLPLNTTIDPLAACRNLIIILSSLDGIDGPKSHCLRSWWLIGGGRGLNDCSRCETTNLAEHLLPQVVESHATSLDSWKVNNVSGSRPRTEPRVGATTLSVAITIKSQHSISLECWEIATNLLNVVPRWSPGVIDSSRTSSPSNVSPNWFSSHNTKVIL